MTALNTDWFPRVRVGIGRPEESGYPQLSEDLLIDYVLNPFAADEEAVIQETVVRVSEVLDCIVVDGIDAAMNRFNSVV